MICLLVETVDKRKFLTSKKNLKALSEFYQRFGATIRLVEANGRGKLLSLDRLAEVICDPHTEPEGFSYDIVCADPYLDSKQQKRALDKTARTLEKLLLSGKQVDLKKFADKIKMPLTSVRLCINSLRTSLASAGKTVAAIKPGVYCIDASYKFR
jgi:hypothetical protein